ncbi:asparagine synthase (glutamine-hydrolyzing) [Reyranella sp. CPCC 100927]|uniref:asparagine synthase (glutamine-hydrolyzing) n=1 Tax=Reyranella sp. CPCC 100927 TaxID=2599616 RepID=UPI0011B56DEA|nr:asparagine synthase (glutamine-hydrolyzing) [Reyranella sp. CPCC 100927]TWT08805.1 asparagine synthase (glutamine-hydrolyzing) [Reyranella sp. CPCC 100927]
MCGIIFWRHGSPLLDASAWTKALGYVRERGPDAEASATGRGWAVGFSRLAIIDLSAAAMQPFTDRTGRHVLAFNGEIYNYLELRTALVQQGVVFRSHSDTEVLLELILHRGLEAALAAVRGMFAFVLLDTQTDRVIAVRDHFGQKPLYWFADGEQIGIASDQRSLNTLRNAVGPDLDAYQVYLSIGGSEGTRGMFGAETSFFAGLNMLPAGHMLVIDKGAPVVRRYFAPWELVDGDHLARNAARPYADLLDEFGSLWEQAVRRHLVADVPAGVLLSGGLDSSMVYWYAQRLANPLTVFTKLSPGIEEIPLAVVPGLLERRPANCYFSLQSPRTYLPELQAFIDYAAAPSRWGGGPPMHRLCVDARRNGVIVLLGGDCADEYLGGYKHYRTLLASAEETTLGPLVGLDPDSPFYCTRPAIAHEARETAVRQEILAHLVHAGVNNERVGHAILLHDTTSFLQSCNLPHSDAYSMMASVELRNPMLDMDLIRFSLNLPLGLRAATDDSGQFGKRILRDLASREIGPSINRKKEGTRNYSMAMADPAFWRLDNFHIGSFLPFPSAPSRRDIIRFVNLELFHRRHIEADVSPLSSMLTAAGIAATDLDGAPVTDDASSMRLPAVPAMEVRPKTAAASSPGSQRMSVRPI